MVLLPCNPKVTLAGSHLRNRCIQDRHLSQSSLGNMVVHANYACFKVKWRDFIKLDGFVSP